MRKTFFVCLLSLFAFTLNAQLSIDGLVCEHLTNPIGIDAMPLRFGWKINSTQQNVMQQAYEIKLISEGRIRWQSGKVISGRSVDVLYSGPSLKSGNAYTWQVRVWDQSGKISNWSAPAHFRLGILDPKEWQAQWISSNEVEDARMRPAQYFRNEFSAPKKIRDAVMFVTAHGMYEAWINGSRVGDAFLTPGWTSYKSRLQYQVYDVTNLLQSGKNALGLIVANGWYRGFLAWNDHKNIYGDRLGVKMQLRITYQDGTEAWVRTDDQWKSSTGAIRYAEIYHGETIDARAVQKGWDKVAFNDQQWTKVKVDTDPAGEHLIATENEPVRKHEIFQPIKIFESPKGEQLIDFGQNLVGWVQLKVRGNAGDTIRIYHAEVLDKKGNFYTDNLRAAKATATFILDGNGEENFESHFTFYGFRYIKVEGVKGSLQADNFKAVALYSDMKPTGTFTSSHLLLNQLQHNIQWGQRGNFLDVPTDCPQRDERLGWTGDAQAFSRTAAFNFDVQSFFSKWMRDVAADQLPNGSIPFVVPNVLGATSSGSAGWADVGTIIPWNMYLAYGDTAILRNQYQSMRAWVEFMRSQSKEDLWNKGFHFGDWLFYRPFDDNDGKSAVTDKYLIAQCFYAHSTQLLINTAKVLGNADDVKTYTTLLENIKAAFLKEYVTGSGRLVSSTQTAYVLALQFDMLPESMRAAAADRLEENITSYGNHLTTGFLGTPYLCHVLSRFGKTTKAFELLLQESYPSWLYPVKMGATTIWERWNGIRTDGSFEPASMNSFNHYAYGAIGDWMYRVVAGIDTYEDGPGYKHIKIEPHIGNGLTHAQAALETPYGKVSSSWKIGGDITTYEIEIPANTKATVCLQGILNGLTQSSNITQDGLKTTMELGSGKYVFTATTKK